ncbi:MAG TPA: hypothetical protein VMT18_15045, partial [Planctomycetota bacterium]|nr:hypothetical protein [Planctomycetota bacterium]
FAACVAFLQGVDPARPDERARRVAADALPALIGVAFPIDEGEDAARSNALRALVWRDHVEVGDLDAPAWCSLFDPRWRQGSLGLAHTPLAQSAEPIGWRADGPSRPARAGLRWLGRGTDRASALKAHGGSDSTEKAVARGLAWLARLQTPNGSWEHGTPRTLEASAWALLALAGDGARAFDEGESAQAIAQGLMWLIAQQRGDSGRFATPLCRDVRSHALALWAAAEHHAQQPLPGLHAAVVRAQAALLEAGMGDGSYPRDVGGREGDVLTTLYAGYALKLRADAGDGLAHEPAARALQWLAARAASDGAISEPEGRTPAATAGEVHLRFLHGLDVDRDALLGKQVGWLVAHPSSIELRHPQLDAEYLLFGAWSCFQVGGDVWSEWNKNMKIQLLQVQRHSGEQDGSWEPLGIGPFDRTTVTSQRVLTFQTYYRYAARAR